MYKRTLTIATPPPELLDRLKKEANLQGTSVSRLACRLLREGLDREKQKRVEFFNGRVKKMSEMSR